MAIAMNWAVTSDMFMVLVALYTAMMGNAFTAMNTLTVDLFPTAFRSVALSLTMICGRIASLVGNILFPVLLGFSCSSVFFSIGAVLLGGLTSEMVYECHRDDEIICCVHGFFSFQPMLLSCGSSQTEWNLARPFSAL